MAETTFMGVPRRLIPWAPTIDYGKCDFCMECADFCPHRVFERREGQVRLVVANPENCVVFCRACTKTCGPDALSFPNKGEVVALIKTFLAERTPVSAGDARSSTGDTQPRAGDARPGAGGAPACADEASAGTAEPPVGSAAQPQAHPKKEKQRQNEAQPHHAWQRQKEPEEDK